MRAIPIGGRHVTLELMKRIRTLHPVLADLTEAEANDIKEKHCYCTSSSVHSPVYSGGKDVLIRGVYYRLDDVLHQACEVLFSPVPSDTRDSDLKTQYSLSIESLEHNRPVPLVRNAVVLVGATTLLPGYVQRFHDTVQSLYADTSQWTVKAMLERNYASWLGGSILGSLSCCHNFFVTKEQLATRLGLD